MEDHSSRKKAIRWLGLVAVFILLQATGRTQEAAGRPGKGPAGQGPARQAGDRLEGAGLPVSARELRYFRRIGDLESAARVFAELFPAEPEASQVAALKAAAALPADRPSGGEVKAVDPAEGAYPVFISPERDRNPSADAGGPAGTIYTAAEQWAGDRPGEIRVRKSTDRGATWPGTLAIGDGRAVAHPSLRVLADDAVGVAYEKDWDGADRDIYFARLDGALGGAVEVPVALSLADQSEPALATDREAYAAPYVYVVYAEREGSAGAVMFRVSQDLGATWSRAGTIATFPWPEGGVETALAFDPGPGVLHAAWSGGRGASTGIAVASSRDFGRTWSRPYELTAAGDGAASGPAIAARGGTVVAAYEQARRGGGRDIGLAHSIDSGRHWTAGGALASTAAVERSPDVRSSEGTGAPRFYASYVEADGRVVVLSAEGSTPGSWTTAMTYPEGGGALALGPAIVLPVPCPQGGEDTGVLWADTSADEDIYFSTSAGILALATLTLNPEIQTVPYTAGTASITVTKVGEEDVPWNAAVTSGGTWLSIQSGGSGTNNGTIVAAFVANPDPATRTGTIQVTPTDGVTPAVTATINQSGAPLLTVTPAGGLTSTGIVGGPFTPSSQAYTLQNTGGTAVDWTAARTQAWTTVSPVSGTLAPGATVTVTVSINTVANSLIAGTYNDTVTFTNTVNGAGNTTRPVALTITTPGVLGVTPPGGFSSSGIVGGPFTPVSQVYTLTNTGGTSINWTAANTQTWNTLSALSGTLAAGATTTVTVTINATANSLAAGTYNDTVAFTNTTNNNGNTTRAVTLTVTAPGTLTVTPPGGLSSSGLTGGPFTPESQAYTLQNTGGVTINWTATKTQAWTTLSLGSGTLAPGATATITVSINAAANSLGEGTYNDTVTFTNTTNNNGNTTRAVTLTITAAGTLVVTPVGGLTSSGLAGGPFTPASQVYTLQNAGGASINWTAAKAQAWTTLSAISGTLAGGATTTVTVSINEAANSLTPGTYNDTVVFTNTTNNNGNTTRAVALTVTAPGALTVTPPGGLASAGLTGGPFTPDTQAYTLQNTGGVTINWTAVKTQSWVTLSLGAGTLAPGATATITVSINAAANSLPAGTYNDTVTFTNTTNGSGNTTRAVTLTITAPGALTVTPAGGLTSSGFVGGPFTPASQVYTLTNAGGVAINWTAGNTQTWTTLSLMSGSLAPAATATVTVSINATANSLAAGTYNDTVTFTNTTNGAGNTTRAVALTVTAPGALTVTPPEGLTSTGLTGGPFTPDSQAYTLQNTGGVAINWTATKTQSWVTLSLGSGTLAPGATATITVSINVAANSLAAGAYSDTVTFTNTTNGSGNTTRAVTLTITAPGALTVTPGVGLGSNGVAGGPFSPASQTYTLTNSGGVAINWTAGNTQTWTTLSLMSGTLAPAATATVIVSINAGANSLTPGTYNDTVTFTNTTNGAGNTTRAVTLTVIAPGALAVMPATPFASAGLTGGPFTPESQAYTLQNTGGVTIDWTVTKTQAWTSLSLASGTLTPGATATITVSINAGANSLTPGIYTDTVTFTNTTNGSGNTTRTVTLTITAPGALSVTPAGGLTSTGVAGGPFTPSSLVYTLTNTGGVGINWGASKLQGWTTLAPTSGSLAAGATATVTVSINTAANSLAAGVYTDTVTFTNSTNGIGNTTRPVSLTVIAPGALTVTPTGAFNSSGLTGGPFTPASQAYTLQNTGGVTINWTAANTQTWTTLSLMSGTLAPAATATVTVSINTAANTLLAGNYTDTVTFTNTTNGSGNTTRPVALTVIAPGALAVSPTAGLASSGLTGGPFTPASQAYTLQNTGGAAITWTAAKGQPWLTLSATTGTLEAHATTTVTVTINATANSLAAGTYNDTVTFTNATNGSGNTTRAVTLTVIAPGAMVVTPADNFASSGIIGGPFTPSNLVYTLTNTGGVTIAYTIAKIQAWTTLSRTAGNLAAGGTTTVTVQINATANSLAVGTYTDTVTFTNTTNGAGNTTRGVTLTVSPTPGTLAVTPAQGFTTTGLPGGPFTPASREYTLQNAGGSSMNWTVTKTQAWTTLSATSGTLAAGASTTVTISVNAAANALAEGTHTDTLTFTNTSNGTGNTTRPVALVVNPGPSLSVTPANRDAPYTNGVASFAVTNAGGGTFSWTAAIVAGADWLTISAGSSGTGNGTITVLYAANPTTAVRVGTIRVTAESAMGSPQDVTVTQAPSPLLLGLTGERLVERAWIIQREYARLTVTINNPSSVPIDRYQVVRQPAVGNPVVVGEVAGPTVGSPWVYNDTFLEPGMSYTFRILALDAMDNVIGASNDITI